MANNILNLTGFALKVTSGPDAGDYRRDGHATVERLPYGWPMGLPAEEPGRRIVVTLVVAEAVPERDDLVVAVIDRELTYVSQAETLHTHTLVPSYEASPALARLRRERKMAEVLWTNMMGTTGADYIKHRWPQLAADDVSVATAARALRDLVELRRRAAVSNVDEQRLAVMLSNAWGDDYYQTLPAERQQLLRKQARGILDTYAVVVRGTAT